LVCLDGWLQHLKLESICLLGLFEGVMPKQIERLCSMVIEDILFIFFINIGFVDLESERMYPKQVQLFWFGKLASPKVHTTPPN